MNSIVCSALQRIRNTVYLPRLPHRPRPSPVVPSIPPRALVEVPSTTPPFPTSHRLSIPPSPPNSMFTLRPVPWNTIPPLITRPAHHRRTEHRRRVFTRNISVRIAATRSIHLRTTRTPVPMSLPVIISRFSMFTIITIIMPRNSMLVIPNTIQRRRLR